MLSIVGVLLVTVMHPRSAYTSDEGAYALQAVALQEGHWAYDHRLAEYDDARGSRFPLVNSDRGGDDWFAYTRHPLWPTVLAASGSLVGNELGFHLPSLLGALGAACAAWCLAGAMHDRAARPAFWLLAAGPLLAHGFLTWAHAPFAAISGFALVLALRASEGRGGRTVVLGCGALLAVGLLLRSEGIFVTAAIGLVVALEVGRRTGLAAGLRTLAYLGLPAVLVLLLERAWVSSILGASVVAPASPAGPGPIGATSSYLTGRVSGATNTLLAGTYIGGSAPWILALAALVVPVLAILALRRGGPRLDVVIGLAAASCLLLIRVAIAPGEPIMGFLPAWPLVVVGLALAGGWLWRGRPALLVRASLVVLLAVLATQYPEGGGLDWGGRFLAALWVPAAALAAAGVAVGWDAWRSDLRGVAIRGGVVLGVASALVSVTALATVRTRHERLIADIESTASTVAISTVPSVPRLAWRTHDDTGWLIADPDDLGGLTRRMAADGIDLVTIVHPLRPTSTGFAEVEVVGDGVWLLSAPNR